MWQRGESSQWDWMVTGQNGPESVGPEAEEGYNVVEQGPTEQESEMLLWMTGSEDEVVPGMEGRTILALGGNDVLSVSK